MAWAVSPTLAAGTDLPTGFLAGDTTRARNRIVYENGRLGPCADAAATDDGVLTTAAPAAGEVGIEQWWGRGRGNWTTDDEDRVDALISDDSTGTAYACADASQVEYSVALSASNLVFTFRNRGAATGGGTGALRLTLIYWQSFDR